MPTTKKPYPFTPLQSAWIDDLINQRYPQAEGSLCLRNKKSEKKTYCCLGVAVIVSTKLHKKLNTPRFLWRSYDEITFAAHTIGNRLDDDAVGDLPDEFAHLLRLNSGNGRLKKSIVVSPELSYGSLAGLNDDAGWTHKQIGEYIRDHPTNVFESLPRKKRNVSETK